MTKREIEILKEEYQLKCKTLNKARNCQNDHRNQFIAESTAEWSGALQVIIALLEHGKRQGSSKPLIDEWEREINFDRYVNN